MATDPNKKTLRHFQCRDYLWETFEQMSAELECSVDYLINEAMRQYARSRSYGNRGQAQGAPAARDSDMEVGSALSSPTATPATGSSPPTGMPPGLPRAPAGASMPTRPPSIPGMPGARPPAIPAMPTSGAPAPRLPSLTGATMPQARPTGTPGAPMARPPAQPLPSMARPSVSPTGVPPMAPPVARPSAGPPPFPGAPQPRMPPIPPLATVPPAAPSVAPPPMARPAPPAMPQVMEAPPIAAGGPVLTAVYQGERYPVTKEEFVIGRGQKTSDLVIRDSNVSRRHAVVVLHNGQYWMVDQQSTNGVEYMGAKIDRKRIDEGDVFKICDYEILFTYR